MSDWHGIQLKHADGGTESLHIGPYRDRKSIALYLVLSTPDKGAWMYPLAYFRSPEAARDALLFLDRLAGPTAPGRP